MPLYEYRCLKCGHRFEEIRKFSDPPEAHCPQCSSEAEKLISAPAFHFKGSGWYVTDYAKKSGSPPGSGSAESDSGEKAKESSGSSSESKNSGDSNKSDSKPAAPASSSDKDKT